MMESGHTELNFDISHALLKSLEGAADRAGVSVSEYLCDAIRSQLVADAKAPKAPAKFGPETVRRMRELADRIPEDHVLPGDSTELLRQMRNPKIDWDRAGMGRRSSSSQSSDPSGPRVAP